MGTATVQRLLGKGYYGTYIGKQIIPDGKLRTIAWAGTIQLLSNDDEVEQSKVPYLLKKKKSKRNYKLPNLFSNARNKIRDFSRELKMTKMLDSQYYLEEETVHLSTIKHPDGLDVDGVLKFEIPMGVAFRPNRRVYGMTDTQRRHNELVRGSGGKQGTEDFFFDAETSKNTMVVDVKLVPIPIKTRKGKTSGKKTIKTYKEIPNHAIDIYDFGLQEEQDAHNYAIGSGLAGTIKGVTIPINYQEELLKIRPALDPNRRVDWRFEEVAYYLNLDLINLIIDSFTDKKTGNFFWKYRRHEKKLKEVLDKLETKIQIVSMKPSNPIALKRIYGMLDALYTTSSGESKFRVFINTRIKARHMEKIVNRIPELVQFVMDNMEMPDNNLLMADVEKIMKMTVKQRKEQFLPYTRQNAESLTGDIKNLIEEYKHDIKTYLYAEWQVIPTKKTADFLYTRQQSPNLLKKMSLQPESADFMEDRKDRRRDQGRTMTRKKMMTFPLILNQ
jgi:hypothetical protein